jgi:hypothetical protein
MLTRPVQPPASCFIASISIVYCLVIVVAVFVGSEAPAASEWVLWVESPAGSDQWSVARTSKFNDKGECERRAQYLNDLELAVAQMGRMGRDARDMFHCLPSGVDPRPEGALR